MIERAYLIVMSNLNYYASSKMGSTTYIEPFEAFISYINAEQYTTALKFGKCFDLDLCRVFSAVAEKCVRLYKS